MKYLYILHIRVSDTIKVIETWNVVKIFRAQSSTGLYIGTYICRITSFGKYSTYHHGSYYRSYVCRAVVVSRFSFSLS